MAATPCVNGASLSDPTNCALLADKDDDVLGPFERDTDVPVEIKRQFFSSNLQSTLSECDGTSCKYVGYDFQFDTGQKYDNLSYVIDISQSGGDKGVFSNVNAVSPTMMVAPPGYTYNTLAFQGTPAVRNAECPYGSSYNPNSRLCFVEAIPVSPNACEVFNRSVYRCPTGGFTPRGWSDDAVLECGTRYCSKVPVTHADTVSGIEACKELCDAEPGCKGFNFAPYLHSENCQLLTAITGDSAALNSVGFKRHDFPMAEGKTNPDAKDSLTYLGDTGNDCNDMAMCNSNIANVFDTTVVAGMSTTDIEACGYCPVKTVKKLGIEYYVRDEVGRSTKYTTRDSALQALTYTNISNPATTLSADSLLGLYKATSYMGTLTRHIFITRQKQIIVLHAEHMDTQNPKNPYNSFYNQKYTGSVKPFDAVAFCFVKEDGTLKETSSQIYQYNLNNAIISIRGDGRITTVKTLMTHELAAGSRIMLYGDDLPREFPMQMITIVDSVSQGDLVINLTSGQYLDSNTFSFPSSYVGQTTRPKIFYVEDPSNGIPSWRIEQVNYVTNGFRFYFDYKYLKRATRTDYETSGSVVNQFPPLFEIDDTNPDKYTKEFAETVFIIEPVSDIGSRYTMYSCPAYNVSSKCGMTLSQGPSFQFEQKCVAPPEFSPATEGILGCNGIHKVQCPSGIGSINIGYVDAINGRVLMCTGGNGACGTTNTDNWCSSIGTATTFTVDTVYDRIFDLLTGSRIYNFPGNLVLRSPMGERYVLESKKLRRVKNDLMMYYIIKNSGTDQWNTIVVPSQDLIDDMPKGPDMTVLPGQDIGPDIDTGATLYDPATNAFDPNFTKNNQGQTLKAFLVQILACVGDTFSSEGIKPCTQCVQGSTATADHKACECTDSRYFWYDRENKCLPRQCEGNTFNVDTGAEPCTPCVTGATATSDHKGCVCPTVANGTNAWSTDNKCTLTCNQGYNLKTLPDGRRACIDPLLDAMVQSALELERVRAIASFYGKIPSPSAPPGIPNSDVQVSLNRERDRIMMQGRPSAPPYNPLDPTEVQNNLNLLVIKASTFRGICAPGGGFYSTSGYEPCTPCSTCTAPSNAYASVTSSGCSTGKDNTTCTYACSPYGFTASIPAGQSMTCSCPANTTLGQASVQVSSTLTQLVTACVCIPGYASATSGYGPCTQCEDGKTYTTSYGSTSCRSCTTCVAGKYVTRACSTTQNRTCGSCTAGTNFSDTTNAASCTPCGTICISGSYKTGNCTANSNITCTPCTACAAAPSYATLTTGGCTGSNDTTCSYTCNTGFTSSGSGPTISCTCPTGNWIDTNTCKLCTTCVAPTSTYAKLTTGGCTGSTDTTCSYACNSGFTSSGSGSTITCTCPAGNWINSSLNCAACSTQPTTLSCPSGGTYKSGSPTVRPTCNVPPTQSFFTTSGGKSYCTYTCPSTYSMQSGYTNGGTYECGLTLNCYSYTNIIISCTSPCTWNGTTCV